MNQYAHVCDICNNEIEGDYCMEHPDASVSTILIKKSLTIDQIKQMLPDVWVEMEGEIYRAMVSGRKNRFATVTIIDKPHISCEVAWNTVGLSLNYETPIKF